MLSQNERKRIIALINREVVPAIGCTEPIAVALCHGDRFGAPDGGDHLPVDEVYDLVAFGLR